MAEYDPPQNIGVFIRGPWLAGALPRFLALRGVYPPERRPGRPPDHEGSGIP